MPRAPKYRVEATWQCFKESHDSMFGLSHRTSQPKTWTTSFSSTNQVQNLVYGRKLSFRGEVFSTWFLWCQVCYLDIYCQIRLSLRTVWTASMCLAQTYLTWWSKEGEATYRKRLASAHRRLKKRFVSTDECEMLVAWLSGHDFLEVVQDPQAGLLIHGEMMWDVHIKRVDISWYFSEGLCAGGICESPGCIWMHFVFWTSRRLGQWHSDPTMCSVTSSFRFKHNGPHYTGIQQVC